MASEIFINYRRDDDAGFAHALYQQLRHEFDAETVFMDVDGRIGPGDDFIEIIDAQVEACSVMLVVIGPRWLDALAARADDPGDFVQAEIRAALEKDKRVVPLLVGGAKVPQTAALPEGIRPLTRKNAFRLSGDRLETDCRTLAESLGGILTPAGADRTRSPGGPTSGPALDHWDKVDPLRVIDAAHLWVLEPPPGQGDISVTRRANPIFQALHAAVLNGQILVAKPDTGTRWLSRISLRRFAEQRGERPLFLYPEDRG